jgi:hypothetical protein
MRIEAAAEDDTDQAIKEHLLHSLAEETERLRRR